jgi:tetratricopeptide (TPR) repeat protein
MGTTTETFGRTVYEAMAWGTIPVATPIPAFREVFSDKEVDYFSGHDPATSAREFRQIIARIEADPEGYRARRVSNHRRVLESFDIRTMATRTDALYDWLETQSPPPRSFSPDDLVGTSAEAFGFVMDTLLSPGPFDCQAEFSALPPKARGIVLWAMVRSGVAREEQRTPLLARAYTLCGPRPVLCVDLGHALLKRRDRRKAEALFGQAAALDPCNMEAHLGRMDARTQMGDKEGARAVLEQALRDNPGVSYLQKLADSTSPS